MFKLFITSLSLLLCCQHVFAETCPSVKDVNRNALKGWKIFDTEEGKPLPPKRMADFIKSAEQFALAEWTDATHKNGSIHCYYRDKNGSALEAYVIKNGFAPKDIQNYWYEVTGFRQCAAGADKCEFQPTRLAQQLAKN